MYKRYIKKIYKHFIPKNVTNRKLYFNFIRNSFISTISLSCQTAISTNIIFSCFDVPNGYILLTQNYLCKDIIGQLCGLYFSHKYSYKIDENTSCFIDITLSIQHLSILLEGITFLFPNNLFIIFASIANMMKNISFIGIGACNAKVINKLSKNNIGELYANITIVNTLASSIGLSIGVILITFIPDPMFKLGLLPILGLYRHIYFKKAIKNIF